MDALAYWVVSDHFEELGRPPRPVPRRLRPADGRQPAQAPLLGGAPGRPPGRRAAGQPSSAATAPRCWSRPGPAGTTTAPIDVLVWNGTVNAELLDGDPRLDRDDRDHRSTGLAASGVRGRCSPASTSSTPTCSRGYPERRRLARRRAVAAAARRRPAARTGAADTRPRSRQPARLTVTLPQPGVARIRLTRRPPAAGRHRVGMTRRTR